MSRMEAKMSSGKHPKTQRPSDRDLKGDPGIGRSKGADMSKTDPEEIDGENTFEGDVENDPDDRTREISPDRQGRGNK